MAAKTAQKSLAQVFKRSAVAAPDPVIPGVFSGKKAGFTTRLTNPEEEGWALKVELPKPDGKGQFTNGVFVAPEGDVDAAVALRALGYGQILMEREGTLTDALDIRARKAKIHPSWLMAAKDCVTTGALKDRGVDEITALPVPKLDTFAMKLHEIATSMLRVGSVKESKSLTKKFADGMKHLGMGAAAKRLVQLRDALPSTAQAGIDIVPLLKELQGLFGAPGVAPSMPSPAFGPGKPGESEPLGDGGFSVLDAMVEWADGIHKSGILEDSLHADWGEMEIVKPALASTRKTQKLAKRWKRGIVGAFRFPWRAMAASDGYAFALRRRIPSGTILVDCSGSMSVSMDQLKQIVESSPHVVVGCYASIEHSLSGRLTLVAEEGRMLDIAMLRERGFSGFLGGGNVVDGPALKWLAAQKEPRVWISDGQVTGKGDQASAELRAESKKICEAARIERVGSISKLLNMMS